MFKLDSANNLKEGAELSIAKFALTSVSRHRTLLHHHHHRADFWHKPLSSRCCRAWNVNKRACTFTIHLPSLPHKHRSKATYTSRTGIHRPHVCAGDGKGRSTSTSRARALGHQVMRRAEKRPRKHTPIEVSTASEFARCRFGNRRVLKYALAYIGVFKWVYVSIEGRLVEGEIHVWVRARGRMEDRFTERIGMRALQFSAAEDARVYV